jgi:hypothetical protein
MDEMPQLIRPMLARAEKQLPRDEDRYGWEFKWDDVRAVAYISGGSLQLLSRSGNDLTASYPELPGMTGVPVILDGEIVAPRDGRPDFGLLQSRMHARSPARQLIQAAPAQLLIFDLDGVLLSLRQRSSSDRRDARGGRQGRDGAIPAFPSTLRDGCRSPPGSPPSSASRSQPQTGVVYGAAGEHEVAAAGGRVGEQPHGDPALAADRPAGQCCPPPAATVPPPWISVPAHRRRLRHRQ